MKTEELHFLNSSITYWKDYSQQEHSSQPSKYIQKDARKKVKAVIDRRKENHWPNSKEENIFNESNWRVIMHLFVKATGHAF